MPTDPLPDPSNDFVPFATAALDLHGAINHPAGLMAAHCTELDTLHIGRDVHAEAAFTYGPFALYGRLDGLRNPDILLAGIIGMGKSALAKALALWAVAFGYRVYVPCDPKGEWTVVAKELGGQTIALGPGLPGRLNPLDAPAGRPA